MRKSFSLSLVCGAVLVVTLPLVGTSAGWGDASTPMATPTDQTKTVPPPPGPDDINDSGRAGLLAGAISKLVNGSPDRYAGVGVPQPESNDLVVFLRGGADVAQAETEVQDTVDRSPFPSAHVAVVTVPRSLNELKSLHAQVDSAHDAIVKLGGDVRGTGPNPATGKIKILVAGDQGPVLAGLGPLADDVELVPIQVKRDTGGGALTSGRYGDSAPWYAGDGEYLAGSNDTCTSGFPVTKPGYGHYMLTAGHCFDAVGTQISAAVNGVNGTWPNGYFSNQSRTYMGYAGQIDFSNYGDSALVTGSYGAWVWIGGTNTTTTYYISGATTWGDPLGTAVCAGGARTGQLCRQYVAAAPFTWYYNDTNCNLPPNHVMYNMVEASGSVGQPATYGDSGGPVYTVSGTQSVAVRGTISGDNCTGTLVYEPFNSASARLAGGTLTVP